jgi:GNAT superfamily N-acetyltransferase
MAEIRVRLTGPADIPAIAALRAQWTGAVSDREFEQHVAAWIAAEGDRRFIWLASLGDTPAGLASLLEYHRMPRPDRLDSCWGYVGNMFVREDLRNRGIGAALLNAIIGESDSRGYARRASRIRTGMGRCCPGARTAPSRRPGSSAGRA